MNSDVLVIGGGVIGASCAYELAKSGRSVALLEKRHVSSGASGSSAAMLEFQIDAHRGEPFYSLSLASNRLFPLLSDEISALLGEGFQYEQCGILHVALTEAEANPIQAEVVRLQNMGHKTSWLDNDALSAKCPYLNSENFGAAFYEEDGQVNGELMTGALFKAAKKKGVQFVGDAGDVALLVNKGTVVGARTNKETFEAKTVVIAAGSWTDQVLAPLNVKLGVKPIRGQLVIYETPNNFLQNPIYTQRHGYLTPKRSGFTLAGTTVEDVGFDESTTDQAKDAIVKMAVSLVPGLARKGIRGLSSGLRPASPDLLPIIGPLASHPNVIVAAGHYRNGFLLAPVTGQLVSSLINGSASPVDPAPFSPQRFSKN